MDRLATQHSLGLLPAEKVRSVSRSSSDCEHHVYQHHLRRVLMKREPSEPFNAGELASLRNLERLNLAFNPLGSRSPELPEVIFKVTTLVELNLDYTGIKVMDVEIGELRNLEALQMEGNQMEYPFHNLYDRHPLLLMYFHNVQMVELDLSGIDLTLLPPVVGRLTALKALDLSRNGIEQVFPPTIEHASRRFHLTHKRQGLAVFFAQAAEAHQFQCALLASLHKQPTERSAAIWGSHSCQWRWATSQPSSTSTSTPTRCCPLSTPYAASPMATWPSCTFSTRSYPSSTSPAAASSSCPRCFTATLTICWCVHGSGEHQSTSDDASDTDALPPEPCADSSHMSRLDTCAS
jgi:hypothetical protein